MNKTFNAYAKLNLLLDIIKKREDGYHDISSVMQSISLHDEINIDISPSKQNEIKVSCLNAGDFSSVKWDESNLVYKAAALLLTDCGQTLKSPVNINISVKKNIPAGAGMGGGSADAAAVLKGLNELLGLELSVEKLCELGKRLGADVPFCIVGGTALCEGIGERITSLPSPGEVPCVILKPEISLSTKEIYDITDTYPDLPGHPDTAQMIAALNSNDRNAFTKACGNFMEPAAIKLCPGINDLKKMLTDAGASLAMMTGSGSAVFGLFTDEKAAKKAFEEITPSKAEKFISLFFVD